MFKLCFRLSVLSTALVLTACVSEEAAFPELPHLNIDPQAVTVAGLSSGGYVAHQLHLAWPETFHGAALMASGPYGCARSGLSAALTHCTGTAAGAPSVDETLTLVQNSAEAGELGRLSLLQDDVVFLYHAGADPVVASGVTEARDQLYQALGAKTHIMTLASAGHGWPVDLSVSEDVVACDETASPFLNACDASVAAQEITALYGHFDAGASEAAQTTDDHSQAQGYLTQFDQRPWKTAGKHSLKVLADYGYVYVPQACENGERCGLQLVLHGCEQSVEAIGTAFIEKSGLLAQADARQLVLLFPQTQDSLANPKGCWDWWGLEGEGYDTREGQQMKALHHMVETVMDAPTAE